MRIFLVGRLNEQPDEAMRKTAQRYAHELRKNHTVRGCAPNELLAPTTIAEIRRFDPDILHFVPGPSIFALMATRTVSALLSDTRIVHSALHHGFHSPEYGWNYAASHYSRPLLPYVGPDLMFTQSDSTKQLFEQYGIACTNIPGGVDTQQFQPVSPERKLELRSKYSLPRDSYICLHVGSIQEWRNLDLLTDIPSADRDLVIVGRTAIETVSDIEARLRESGAIIIDEYIKDIQEIYALADCYVFPTKNTIGCCEIPLSILEAMSCNLSIVTTPFGGLPDILPVDNRADIKSATTRQSFVEMVDHVREVDPATRMVATQYDWSTITAQIEKEYTKLVQ